MSGFHHLGCAACGSTLGLREGQRLVRCTHCEAEYLALAPGFVPRFYTEPVVDARGALAAVQRSLRHPEVERSLAKEAKLSSPELYWVPFYEVDGLQVSTFVERRQGRVDTRMAFVDYQAQGAAESVASWGLAELRPRTLRQQAGLALRPAVPEAMSRRGHVLPVPPIPASATSPNEPIAAKNEIVAAGSKLFGVECRYVYLPVWRVEVWDRRHPYTMVVEGSSGQVVAGRLPQDRRLASLWLLVTLGFFGLFFGRSVSWGLGLEHLLILLELWSVVVPVLGGLVAVLFVALAVFWSETRFRGEVVFRANATSVEKLGRPPETQLERWAAKVAGVVESLIKAQLRAP